MRTATSLSQQAAESESGVGSDPAVERRDIVVACPCLPPQIAPVQEQELRHAVTGLIGLDGSIDQELERQLALILKAEAFSRGAVKTPQTRFEERPAAEAAVQPLWPALMRRSRTAVIDDLVGALIGGRSERRRQRSSTIYARDGTRSLFPAIKEAQGWLDRIEAAEHAPTDPFALACFAYAQTVLSHPYVDGNGRLARVMYQRSLGRSGLLSGPFLPLGPLVYANHRAHNRALQHLGSSGDWAPFVAVMLGLTRKAAAFTRHILSMEGFVP